MEARELQRLCAKLVDRVELPDPFDVNALVDTLEQQRGRQIEVLPLPEGISTTGPCGLWVATEDVDYLFYNPNTSRQHKVHILLHEIGHMLFGHGSAKAKNAAIVSRLLPTLNLSLVQSVLGRTDYDEEDETAAELFATEVTVRARRSSRTAAPATAPVGDGVAKLRSHLGRSLERKRRR